MHRRSSGDNLEGDVVQVLLDLLVLELSPNETLGGEKGRLGVDDGLALGGKTNETLTVLGEGNNGRGGSAPSEFSMTRACWPSMTETHELVAVVVVKKKGGECQQTAPNSTFPSRG